MQIQLFHEIDPDSVDRVLRDGIKRDERGEKSDTQKKKIDTFLDTHLPEWAKEHDVRRDNVVYCYLAQDDDIVDITDGEPVKVKRFMAKKKQTLLRVRVEIEDCCVSDLDAYDTLVRAMELDEQDGIREHLADRYWARVFPLSEYETGIIKRPEVMVVADIDPRRIEIVDID